MKTVDFSGCPMNCGSYNDQHSFYGWNIDHIMPLSIKRNNNLHDMQPVNIETNIQKSNRNNGSIVHEYGDINVITYFEIRKSNNEYFIYVIRQFNDNENIIENIYFKNEIGYYIDDNNNIRKSRLNVNKSLQKKCLIFQNGKNPAKWPIQ